MKCETKRMTALFVALLLLLGMAATGLAQEASSAPFELGDRVLRATDDKQEDPELPQGDPENPEVTGDPEEQTDSGEDDPQGSTSPKPVPGRIVTDVAGSQVNMRKAPNSDSEIITQIPDGAEVGVLAREGNWVLLDYQGAQGYVYGKFVREPVTEDEETPTEGTVVTPPVPVERKARLYADKNPDELHLGDVLEMWVELIGYDNVDVTIQWQICVEGDAWTDIDGATGPSYAVTITQDNAGHSWRARIFADG